MDHQTFAQLLGNYGEFVGAVAVVITLVYLAVQVRHSRQATEVNTTALLASNYAAWNDAASSWGDFVARHSARLCAISEKSTLDELSADERYVAIGLAVKVLNQGQAVFLYHREGSLPEDIFRAHLGAVANQFDEHPVMRDMWPTIRMNFPSDFCDLLESKVESLKSYTA